MKNMPMLTLVLALGLGTTMCGTKEHPQPATQAKPAPAAAGAAAPAATATAATAAGPAKKPQEEKMTQPARWVEVSAASQKFLVAKIADAGHRPAGEFEGSALLGKPGVVLFYVLVPDAAAAVEISQVSGGGKTALAKPRRISRMPGSALYTAFAADPAKPPSLAFKAAGKEDVVALSAPALQALPFFWSGEPASVAFEEVPGWMEGSGP